jgi:hypothetical protein
MVKYHYSDGSGNAWHLIDHRLSYEPVATINSSSLVYNGGTHFEVELSPEQLETLLSMFSAACKNKTFLQEKRTLGSAQIRRIEAEETFSVIIAMRSPDKARIENFLSQLRPVL